MVRRLGVLAAVALGAIVFAISSAHAALFFLFQPASADAGDLVTVRLGGTPAGFEEKDAERPSRKAIRLYLVSREVAGEVGSRFDPRLHFVGRIVPDRNSRGVLRFRVPPLDTGAYALAYWCPGCAAFSRGVTFGVQTVPQVSRYRRWMGLRVRMPSATGPCPVSGEGPYGNGLLTTRLPPAGVISRSRESDGTIFDKPGWVTKDIAGWELTVRGERLDGPGQLRVLGVRSRSGTYGDWRTALTFSDEGCWRITGRVGDVSLSYVVKVVAAP
jgi:hypothetical protein